MTGEDLVEKIICEQTFEGSEGRAMRLSKGRENVLGKGNSKRERCWGHSKEAHSVRVT